MKRFKSPGQAQPFLSAHNEINNLFRRWCRNWVPALTTYQFWPEVVDGLTLGMMKARSWLDRVIGWVGLSMGSEHQRGAA